jgi:RNA polymerase sigma-70 factor (ECF subfamily)
LNLRTELERHHQASYGWALACSGRDRVRAEDVLQTVYVKVLEGRACYDGHATFKTWLFAVIRKTAADAWRHHLLRARWVMPQVEGALPAFEERVAESDERAERLAQVRQMLAALPTRQRQVLHLVFYQELSLREASVVMGVSIGSARRHYERAKRRLRQWLAAPEVSHESGSRRPTIPDVVR